MKLKELSIKMHQGINTVADKVEYLSSGIPIIQSKNINKGYLDLEDVRYLGKDDKDKYSEKYNPQIGDILVSNIGTIGKSHVIDRNEDFLIAWNLFLIKINEKICIPKYVKFYFDSMLKRDAFDRLLSGGTVKFINKDKMGDIEIPMRNINEQEKIVQQLSYLEQIIFKKNEQFKLYDDLIKSRFVEMFGDIFNGKSNYPTVKISDVVVSKIGRAKMYFNGDDEIKYVDISSVNNKKNIIDGYTEYLMKDAPSRAQQHVRKDDIIISTVRPNLNNVAKVQHDYLNIVASSGFCVLRASKVESNFLFALVSMKSFADYLASLTTGANYPAVSDKDILNFEIPNAPIEEQIKFSDLIEQVEKLKVGIQKSLNETQILFNSLMQEYFG